MAGMNIFTLTGTILVDNAKANDSLSKTGKESEGLVGKLGGGISKMKNFALVATAVVGTVTAVGTAAFKIVEGSATAADRIDKMSQRLGMSRTAFQEWDFILSQNGVSMDSMNTAMKSMTASMASLAEGGKKGQDTLAALGISVEDLKNLKQEEIFEKTVVALQKMPEGYEKARLAQQLFGKQGQEMLPMLNQSKGSIEELKNKAHELGLVMNDESVSAGVKFTDTMDQLKRAFTAVWNEIGVKLMPIFQSLAEWIIKNMPIIQKIVSVVFGVIEAVLKTTGVAIDSVITVFSVLFKTFEKVGEIAIKTFDKVKVFVEDTKKKIVDTFTDLDKKMLEAGKKLLENLWEGMKSVWENLKSWMKEKVEEMAEWLEIDFTFDDSDKKPKPKSNGGGTAFKAAGSHKTGLNKVPYDDYPAYLHKNEMVLTANQAEKYRENQGNTINNFNINASNIKELNDLIRIAENAKRINRMGVANV